ncbi:MAG: tail fiber domain-containing protein, partial [Bdellovibrio sp.]
FNDGSFAGWEDSPDQAINYSGKSIDSLYVGGFPASSLLRFAESDGTLVNTSPLSNAQYTELTNLIAGSSSKYLRSSTTAGTQIPVVSSQPSSLSAGQMWYEAGSLKYYDGANSQVRTLGTGTVTSVSAGTGLSGGPITGSGSLALASGVATPGTYRSVTVDTYGRVTAGSNPTTAADYGLTDVFKNGGSAFSGTGTLGTTDNNDLSVVTNGSTRMTVLKDGNVGIGTASPTALLDVNGGVRYSTLTHSSAALIIGATYSYTGGITTGTAMNIQTNSLTSGTALRVLSSGNGMSGYLISANYSGSGSGTALYGAITNASATGDALLISNNGTGLTARFNSMTGDTTPVVIDNSGNLGVGVVAPGYKLDVNGVVRADSVTNASDRRLKKDINSLATQEMLEKVLALRGVSYHWRSPVREQNLQVGFIAQEMEQIFPDLVSTDSQGMKSVNYTHLIAPVTSAVQALNAKIEQQESALEYLRKENQLLKAYICERDPKAAFCP